MVKAVGYTLVHTSECEESNESLQDQKGKILRYARSVGLRITEVHSDNSVGVMPTTPELGEVCSRGPILKMLDTSGGDHWQYVIVTSLDRLKHPDIDVDAKAVLEANKKHVLVVGQPFNLGVKRPPKKAKKKLPVAQRLYLGRVEGAKKGNHQSGPAPYGYDRIYTSSTEHRVRLVINPVEAPIVNLIFTQYLRLRSMKRVIEFLGDEGIKTRRRKAWSRAGIAWILKNRTYLGMVHFGPVRVKGRHPALVSRITFNKVQVLVDKNNRRKGKREKCPSE